MSEAHKFTIKEEIAHTITHGIGAILSVFGLILLLEWSIAFGNIWHIVSSIVYGGALVTLYVSSTLYHSAPYGKVKNRLQKLDHAVIYIMIAGSYTPLTLISLHGVVGWVIFSIIWSLAIFGLLLDLFAKKRHHKTAITLYLIMGWMIVFVIKPVIASVAINGIWLLVAGGVSYTTGVIFYVWKSLPYNHVIWHLFVLGGSAFQYCSILFYMIPNQ